MKILKWFWLTALLTIGFKLYKLVFGEYSTSDVESFVGMLLAFVFISVVFVAFWVIGRVKEKINGKTNAI